MHFVDRLFTAIRRVGNPVVVGIDPIWVIRHEDYEMLTHWSHPVAGDKKQKEQK